MGSGNAPAPEDRSDPRDRLIALAVAAAVLVVQLPFRDLGVSLLDEGSVVHIAADVARGAVPYRDGFHYVFPGSFYLVAGAFRLAGTSVDTARVLACLIFALATGAAYLIARWFVGRRAALAVSAWFVAYRVWAYPQWQLVHYSSLAMAALLVAALALGASLGRTRLGAVTIAGVAAGVAVLAKQDSGGLGTIVLGVAVLLLCRPLRPSVLAFGAGWVSMVGGCVAMLVAAGAGPDFVEQAIVRPLSTNFRFDYPLRPSLWLAWRQDPTIRASPFSYAPPILAELHWGSIVGSRLYTDTAVVDAALKVVFHLPWILCLVGAGIVVVRARRGDFGTLRTRRLALLVLLSAGSVLAYSPPQDWTHCLVLYPPALLLLVALTAPLARYRVVCGAVAIGIGLALVASAGLALELRRHFDTPVRSARGTLWATAPQAQPLQALLDRLGAAPRDAPLVALPYHPLINFLAARSSPTRFGVVWPADPPELRDAEIIRRLTDVPSTLVVYSETLAPFLPRLQSFAPSLFAFLVRHYAIGEVFGGDPRGFSFLLLAPSAPPSGASLLGPALAGARVTVEDGSAPPREARDLVGEALWPFLPVLRTSTLPDAAVSVAYGLTPSAGQRLETRYGINPDRWIDVPPPRTRFAVAIRDAAGEHEIWSAEVDPTTNAADRRWAVASVDLSPWAGHAVDLVLRVRGPRGAPPRADSAGWGDPRLVAPTDASRASTADAWPAVMPATRDGVPAVARRESP